MGLLKTHKIKTMNKEPNKCAREKKKNKHSFIFGRWKKEKQCKVIHYSIKLNGTLLELLQ